MTPSMHRVGLAALLAMATSLNAQTDWVQFPSTSGPSTPVERLVFMESLGMLVSYGGYVTSEVWGWDGSSWRLLDPGTQPQQRWAHAVSYEPATSSLLMFGGASGYWRDDMWRWDGSAWTELRPATRPSPRAAMEMVYDSRRGVHVLFGGDSRNVTLDDTWEWTGSRWIHRPLAVRPAARSNHAMAYDEARQEVVLFGGGSRNGALPFGDTWTYDGTAWRRRSPTNLPPARSTHSMVWDPHRARVVMHAGESWPWSPPGNNQVLSDTWEWDGSDWQQRIPVTVPTEGGRVGYDLHRRVTVLSRGRQGETWFYFPRFAAYADPIGQGCASDAGRGPTPSVEAVDAPGNLPWIDSTFTVALRHVPAGGQPMMVFGVSRRQWAGTPLPIALGPFGGAPGCTLAVSPDFVAPMTAHTVSQGRLSFQIPNLSSLLGREFFAQGLVVEGAASASRLTTSNALRLQFGAR